MAGKPNRGSRATKCTRTQRSRVRDDPGLAGALEEIERVLATPYLCRDRASSARSGVCWVELLRAWVARARGWWGSDSCARGRPALLRSTTLGLAPGPAT